MDSTASSRTTRWLLATLLLGGAACAVSIALYNASDTPEVTYASPSYGDVESSVTTIGKVVPVDDFQARSNFPGMIDDVCVRLGDKVKPGQLLIRMKVPFAHQRVAAAQANFDVTQVSDENVERGGSQEDRINMLGDRDHAEMEQSSAENGLKALKELQPTGAVSDAEIGAATQRLQAANATLNTMKERASHRYSTTDIASWKARVSDARANLEAQKVTFTNANITSPIAGTVYVVPVRAYDFVPSGADLLHVADLTRVEIHALFDEPDMGKLHDGEPVRIGWEGHPGAVWTGHIRKAPLAAISSGGRNVGESTIAVDDAKGELPPNIDVTVAVVVQRHQHVLTIPHQALQTEDGATFVYRVVDKRLVRTPVKLGVIDINRVEVTAGVGPADILALHTNDHTELKNHMKVLLRQ